MDWLGIDVGGTFTDLVFLDRANGRLKILKTPSTPHDQSEGVLNGLRELCDIAGVRPDDVSLIVHGTTVATNITIEHTGAEVGMLTSRNFRDILHIGRHKRPYNFSLHFEVPWQQRPLVKRRNRIPVTERILPPDGKIEVPLDETEVLEAIRVFKRRGIKSVVIGFLFSFLNDAHERLCLPTVDDKAVDGLKFSRALPRHLAEATLAHRLADFGGAKIALAESYRFTSI